MADAPDQAATLTGAEVERVQPNRGMAIPIEVLDVGGVIQHGLHMLLNGSAIGRGV
jgi:hypothetical protein